MTERSAEVLKVAAMVDAYKSQARVARRRGIGFTITFEEWRDWWLTDNRWDNRGRAKAQFVMARKGDTGPYDLSNIYLATQSQNLADIPRSVMVAAGHKGSQTLKAKPGAYSHLNSAVHPRRLSIRSPDGLFPSIAAAGRHYGLTAKAIGYRLSAWDGWERVLPQLLQMFLPRIGFLGRNIRPIRATSACRIWAHRRAYPRWHP